MDRVSLGVPSSTVLGSMHSEAFDSSASFRDTKFNDLNAFKE
jgi:hypothetical protein